MFKNREYNKNMTYKLISRQQLLRLRKTNPTLAGRAVRYTENMNISKKNYIKLAKEIQRIVDQEELDELKRTQPKLARKAEPYSL